MITYCYLMFPSLFPCTWLTKDFGYKRLTKTKKKKRTVS